MRRELSEVERAIEDAEDAISAVESRLDDLRDRVAELRALASLGAVAPDMPDPATERKRLEEWNRLSRAS